MKSSLLLLSIVLGISFGKHHHHKKHSNIGVRFVNEESYLGLNDMKDSAKYRAAIQSVYKKMGRAHQQSDITLDEADSISAIVKNKDTLVNNQLKDPHFMAQIQNNLK